MEIIDLSKPIVSGMHAHITTSIVPVMRIGDAAGKFDPPCEGFASNLIVMSDHCGTHFDAPTLCITAPTIRSAHASRALLVRGRRARPAT